MLSGDPGMALAAQDGDDAFYEVIVKYNRNLEDVAAELDVMVEILDCNYAIITLPPDRIVRLYDYPQIEYIEWPKTLTANLRLSLESACVPAVRDSDRYGLTGQGVMLAVIDSGIDYTHPDFRNGDGSTRILFLWDQLGDGTPPDGFSFGTEYDAAQINAALSRPDPYAVIPDMDIRDHGTAVAGVAAGNGRASGGLETGVAPMASLVVVRLGNRGRESFARTTEIMRAVKYVYDKAVALNMPLSVNISFGTNHGSHDGNSLFEGYINDMCNTWRSSVVVAAGNEGAAGHHYSAILTGGETLEVAFTVGRQISGMYMTMWKHFVDDMSVELILPGGESSGVLDAGRSVGEASGRAGRVTVFYGQPTKYNKDQEIYFSFQATDTFMIEGVYRLIVRGNNVVNGRIDLWLPTIEEVGTDTAFFLPDTSITLTLPATASNVISVGAYVEGLISAADFSGRGFTRNNIYVKPDIVAPGVRVLAPHAGGGYGSFTGTSIAAPFVAGSAALMMEWGIVRGHDPFLFGQRLKAFLRRGAIRAAGRQYPNTIWGYGRLCVRATMDELFLHL